MTAPSALRMNSGSAPTDLQARTGLLTPPGITFWASLKSWEDFVAAFMGVVLSIRHRLIFSRRKIPEGKIGVKEQAEWEKPTHRTTWPRCWVTFSADGPMNSVWSPTRRGLSG